MPRARYCQAETLRSEKSAKEIKTYTNFMNLKQIGVTAHEINESNGWEVFNPSDWPLESDLMALLKSRFIATHIALIHSEVSEALEALRKGDGNNFAEEMADIIIRVTSVSAGLGIDLDAEVEKKMEINRGRGFRHGGKAI